LPDFLALSCCCCSLAVFHSLNRLPRGSKKIKAEKICFVRQSVRHFFVFFPFFPRVLCGSLCCFLLSLRLRDVRPKSHAEKQMQRKAKGNSVWSTANVQENQEEEAVGFPDLESSMGGKPEKISKFVYSFVYIVYILS